MKKQNIVTALLFVAAAVLVVIGIASGEPIDVMRKATTICLECIGVG